MRTHYRRIIAASLFALVSSCAFADGISGGLGGDSGISGKGVAPAAATPPGGANTNVQYNASGSFAGDAGFVYNTPGNVTATGTIQGASLTATGTVQGANLTVTSLSGTGTRCVQTSAAGVVSATAAACAAGGSTPGGASTNVQYNAAGSFGGDAGFIYTTPGQVFIGGATVTTNSPVLDLTQTWNAAGVAFQGIRLNITNTASSGLSTFLDLRQSGTSVFSMGMQGSYSTLWMTGAAISASNYILQASAGAANAYLNGMSSVNLSVNTLTALAMTSSVIDIGSNYAFGWNPTTSAGTVVETSFYRDAAYTVGQRNGVNPNTFRVYNTSDAGVANPVNYERGVFDWTTTANTLTIGTQKGGTGAVRTMMLVRTGLYSAAGIALPACAAGLKGYQTVVSDATTPTYNATYTSGGAITAQVICNGTNWVTQ